MFIFASHHLIFEVLSLLTVRMYQRLETYKEAHDGSIEFPAEIPEEEKNNPEMKEAEILRKWCNAQLNHQHRYAQGHSSGKGSLTDEKIEKMKEIGLQLFPSYDDKFEKLFAHKAETGTLDVEKDEDEELFVWANMQKKVLAQHFLEK